MLEGHEHTEPETSVEEMKRILAADVKVDPDKVVSFVIATVSKDDELTEDGMMTTYKCAVRLISDEPFMIMNMVSAILSSGVDHGQS